MEEKKRTGSCEHASQEREWDGTWVSMELDKALQCGYKVTRIYEVWHWERWMQYDGKDESTGLFVSYINQFLKLKQQADGYPSWVQTEEDKDEYIQDYFDHEGILLEKSQIKKNPGLRSLAKLMLNSFWGKFGQRTNLQKHRLFADAQEFFKLVGDPLIDLRTLDFLTKESVLAGYSPASEDCEETLPSGNVVIAAITTAQARLKLYEEMEKLGDRVIYTDTDSLLFITRPDDSYDVQTGSYLGDLTDEVEKDYGTGAMITEVICAASKSYGYQVKMADGEIEDEPQEQGIRPQLLLQPAPLLRQDEDDDPEIPERRNRDLGDSRQGY